MVDGHILALDKGKPGERYLLTGENASFMHVFDIAATITNTKRPFFNIPLFLINLYGWVSVVFCKITGKLPLISPPVFTFPFTLFTNLLHTIFYDEDEMGIYVFSIDE